MCRLHASNVRGGEEPVQDDVQALAGPDGLTVYADTNETSWCKIVEELRSVRVFRVERVVAGVPMLAPQWDDCPEHEFQAGAEAVETHTRGGYSIGATNDNDHHQSKHWVTLLSTSNRALVHTFDNKEVE